MAYKLQIQGPPLECDLVMKGGITSGVVYPKAAVALAGKYRLRRVGGSSAGAIAAAMTVAAEYRRSGGLPPGEALPDTPEKNAGWERLDQLPDFLAKHLIDLFVPSLGTRSVFDFFVAWLEPKWSLGKKVRTALGRLVLGAPFTFTATLVVCLIPAFATATALVGGLSDGRLWLVLRSLLVWLPVALLVAVIAAGVRQALGAVRVINSNGFGLVNGHRPGPTGDPDAPEPLTDWLTREVNLTAGLPASADSAPLTFGDLWGSEATEWFFRNLTNQLPGDDEARRKTRKLLSRPGIIWTDEASPLGSKPGFNPILDLRVMTTCLSHRLPRSFPFSDETYFYCPACLGQYFPESVVKHVQAHSRDPYNKRNDQLDLHCPTHRDTEIRRLPFAPYLPIVMAARLSLSFPVLISAVPFYCFDYNTMTGQREVVTAWFSDGGITSNFPMQFFDAWIPDRPTFGINLEDFNERYNPPGEFVHLRTPTESASTPITPITSVAVFLKTLGMTMHGWPDQLQMDAPGFRDRVITVLMGEGQGGLNLKMSREEIESLAGLGATAGAKVVNEFDYQAHLWLRFRITMNGISLALARLRRTFPAFEKELPSRWTGTKKFQYPEVEQRVRDDAKELIDTANQWASRGWPATGDKPSRPEPELRFGTGTK